MAERRFLACDYSSCVRAPVAAFPTTTLLQLHQAKQPFNDALVERSDVVRVLYAFLQLPDHAVARSRREPSRSGIAGCAQSLGHTAGGLHLLEVELVGPWSSLQYRIANVGRPQPPRTSLDATREPLDSGYLADDGRNRGAHRLKLNWPDSRHGHDRMQRDEKAVGNLRLTQIEQGLLHDRRGL